MCLIVKQIGRINEYRMKYKILSGESCKEELSNMPRVKPDVHLCLTCDKNVHDLTHKSLNDIAMHFFGKGNCVVLQEQQKEFFQKMKLAGLITAFGLSLSFVSNSQSLGLDPYDFDKIFISQDSCRVYGKIKTKTRRKIHSKPSEGEIVWIRIDSTIYETKTDESGFYELIIPLKSQISESSHDEIKINADTDNKESHIPNISSNRIMFRTIGCPAF